MSIRFLRFFIICAVVYGFTASLAIVYAENDAPKEPAKSEDKLAGPPEQKTDQKSDNQQVVIQGVKRLKVKAEKPEPDIKFDVDDIAVPAVKTEDSVLDVSPTSMASPPIALPSSLDSTQAAAPYIQLFRRPPILTLRPKYSNTISIAKWRLRITDGFGNVFRDYSGERDLPKEIIWDGKSKDGSMLDVGASYSYIFSIIDVASNPTSQMGKPIILESLLFENQGNIIAKVVADVIFEKKERKTDISDKGKLYLREIADFLIAKQNYPLIIEAYFEDVDDATYKGEIVQDYLAQLLTMPKTNFKVVAQKSRIKKLEFKFR